MSNKKLMAAMAMALAMGHESVYDDYFGDNEPTTKEHKPYSTDGLKCGQCTKFRTNRCRCSMAKETSPACSQMTIK